MKSVHGQERSHAGALVVCAIMGLAACSASGNSATSSASASASASSSAASGASASSSTTSGSPMPLAVSDAPTAAEVIGEGEWGDLLESLGSDAVAFGRRAQAELPEQAYAQWSGEGGGEPVEFTDPAQVRALFNALASASLAGEAQEVLTDDYTSFWFVFADGQRFSFSFDSMAIDLPDDGSYTYYDIAAGDDLYAFAAIARQQTMASYER